MESWTPLEWLALVEHELLLFAGVFFLVGALDELAVDLAWVWLKVTRRARTGRVDRAQLVGRTLAGKAALLIPAWQEDVVIGHTIAHALEAWPQAELQILVGCYRNDPKTPAAAALAAGGDERLHIVRSDRDGPTTKADCLNRLFAELIKLEHQCGQKFRMIVLHDAEDMVDPAALGLLDRELERADFVQLPVLPVPQPQSRWIGSHYCEEFAESHSKSMVVRQALGAAIPGAGVGLALSRELLGKLAADSDGGGPFAVESLTEDYELGLRVAAAGGRSRFVRVRGEDGELIATRACFPARIDHSVRQKARWVHGIALQGWDRLGWTGGLGERWMRLRDRRGPLAALILFAGYLMLIGATLLYGAGALGLIRPWQTEPWLEVLLALNIASFAWRAVVRCAFTVREYGWAEGLRAVPRIVVANVIAIMAGRRALAAYIRSLRGETLQWDKTLHDIHPAAMPVQAAA